MKNSFLLVSFIIDISPSSDVRLNIGATDVRLKIGATDVRLKIGATDVRMKIGATTLFAGSEKNIVLYRFAEFYVSNNLNCFCSMCDCDMI